jgi:4-amino-4-deoxy-L-arabinose transferase-like glycosyltransferase
MVFWYIGALKSWLYTPIFAVFGTSAASIRVPVVLIVTGSLVLLYIAVRELVNRPVALLALVALSFDNSVLWLTRDDVGPNALEFSLKCAALFCAARFARAASTRWLVLLLVALALGVFNKINFIWTVNAVAAVSVIVLVRRRRSLRENRRLVAIWLGGLAIIYAGFALYYFIKHIGSVAAGPPGATLTQPWALFDSGMQGILSGTWFYGYLYPAAGTPGAVAIVFIGLFAAGALAGAVGRRSRSFAVAALALVTLLTAVQVLFTVQATAGWHYFAIYPTVTIVVAYGVYALARALLRRERRVYLALATVAAAILVYDGALIARSWRALSSREPVYSWSPAIYQLSRDLQRRPGYVFTVDWGIGSPLFALHPTRRYVDLEFALNSAQPNTFSSIRGFVSGFPGPKTLVTHPQDKAAFPRVNANMAKVFGGHLRLDGTVTGLDHRPIFEIYSLR